MLPKTHRLRSRTDFDRLFADGHAFHGQYLTVRAAAAEQARIGFVVGKRVSAKATVRNRTKRRLRGLVRARPELWELPALIGIYARPGAERTDSPELDQELTELLRKAKLVK